jgi:heat shock protein HspQ|tara:strand:+ start:495 stop:803 length:309 start_codon:yes stop_codon:yes gene_type:complete
METTCQFSIGQIIHHLKFNYRGVIIDVDASFESSEEWYEMMAKSNPPKDKPWYHVLVNKSTTTTYVAEQNLEEDSSKQPILHPLVDVYFSRFEEGRYLVDVS